MKSIETGFQVHHGMCLEVTEVTGHSVTYRAVFIGGGWSGGPDLARGRLHTCSREEWADPRARGQAWS